MVLVCLSLALASCSVGMALSGKKDPNLGMIRQGSTRGEVELELGSPITSVTHADGKRTDVYEYELGNEPSTGRAIAWGVLDVLTLGLWELAGTPIELLQGKKHQLTALYGPDNRLISMQASAVLPPTEAKKEDEGALGTATTAGVPQIRPLAKTTSGTCFAVNQNGTLLTAYHLVKDAKSIRVHLIDGTTTEAKLQTFNAKKDLAILRIDPRTPHYLSLAPDESVRVGERVFTMGYPAPDLLGQEPKFTEGSISALSGPGGETGLLQVSVPVQPGNSGGPLINEHGRVVGVISSTAGVQAFLSATGALPQNVNWAIKADYARALFDASTPKSVRVSREETVKDVREALCMVEASLVARPSQPSAAAQFTTKEEVVDHLVAHSPYRGEWVFSGPRGGSRGGMTAGFTKDGGRLNISGTQRYIDGDIKDLAITIEGDKVTVSFKNSTTGALYVLAVKEKGNLVGTASRADGTSDIDLSPTK